MLLVLFLYMLFASTFTLGKAVLAYIDPIFFIGIRMVAGGLLLLGYQYFFNYRQWRFEKKDIYLFVHIIFFHIYLAFVLEFWALQYVASAKACLLFNLSPFITALFSRYLLDEYLRGRQWLGLAIGFIGFLPVLVTYVSTEATAGALGFFSAPEVALLIAVCSSAYGWIVLKKLVVKKGYSIVMVNGVGMMGGGLLALITSYIWEGMSVVPMATTDFVMLFSYTFALILIANVICYNLYGFLLKRYSATYLAFSGFTTPLFAALFGWLFLKETLSWNFFVTVGLVFIGLYLFYKDELK